jgi:Fic/DOC family
VLPRPLGECGKFESILQSAAAHHRLVWIHPFADGNGRITRLISHATLLEALNSGGIWSIARGLSRHEQEYRGRIAACDTDRRNDLDGRGLRKRIMDWAKEEERLGGLLPHSTRVLAHILTLRELERKDVKEVVGFDDRKARRVTALLHKRGIISAPTHRAPFRIALGLPAAVAPSFMPGLYPKEALRDAPAYQRPSDDTDID